MDFSTFEYEDAENLTDAFYQWYYVRINRGVQQLPLSMAIPLTVVNLVIFVTGLIGNAVVCTAIIKFRYLHTATNYYLFNLAVSDLILLIFGLPNDVALYWHQYPFTLGTFFCKFRALLSEMSSYVSVLTIVAFSTERFIAICYPLYSQKISKLKRVKIMIACIWLLAFVGASPFSLYSSVDYLVFPPNSSNILEDSAYCGMLSQPPGVPLIELSTIVFFLIPLVVMAVQYTLMARRISETFKNNLYIDLETNLHTLTPRSQANRNVIRMLGAVVVAFFVCWAPFHAQRLLVIYGRNDEFFAYLNAWIYFATGILYYLSSTLNPILYNVMSDKMRHAFAALICGREEPGEVSREVNFREVPIYRGSQKKVNMNFTEVDVVDEQRSPGRAAAAPVQKTVSMQFQVAVDFAAEQDRPQNEMAVGVRSSQEMVNVQLKVAVDFVEGRGAPTEGSKPQESDRLVGGEMGAHAVDSSGGT